MFLARYTKWGEAYAAKEEKKKSKAKGRDMPDPNKVDFSLSQCALIKYYPKADQFFSGIKTNHLFCAVIN